MSATHVGTRFDRLPTTAADRVLAHRVTREEVGQYFADRFGIDPAVFDPYSFWERGKGKVWAFRGEHSSPVPIEALGIHLLRTDHAVWKPTTDGMQLFGSAATRNVVTVPRDGARAFWNGEVYSIDRDGVDGYVLVAHDVAGQEAILGVGRVSGDRLESLVPKGRQRSVAH